MYPASINSFNEIYMTFYRKSVLFVKSYIHDDLAAEDIAAEALIKLWERIKIEPIDPVAPFLFTILKNSSLDYLKHQVVRKAVHDAIAESFNRELEIRTTALEACDPSDIFSDEVQKIFESTLNSLPEKTREIFLLSRFGNKPHKEIAELFGITIKGVDYHIMQSIKELKVSLSDYLPLLVALGFLN
jgi:RNA polymerase sigma-70 factor (ECF subfamily)